MGGSDLLLTVLSNVFYSFTWMALAATNYGSYMALPYNFQYSSVFFLNPLFLVQWCMLSSVNLVSSGVTIVADKMCVV